MADTDDLKLPDLRPLGTTHEERLREIGRNLYADVRKASEREEAEMTAWHSDRKKGSADGDYSPGMFDLLWENGDSEGDGGGDGGGE